jgi:hypothetical protein
MNNNNILSHGSVAPTFAGAAGINFIISLLATQQAVFQSLAAIATVVAACVSIYFAIRNRKK